MKRKLLTMTCLLVLAFFANASSAVGQEGTEDPAATSQAPISVDGTVASKISYQGVLREGGSPVTGTRNLTFSFFNNAACSGTAVATVTKPGVAVSNGLFSVALDVPQDKFNGQGLWLRVQVGGTNLSCQELLAAAYALSLRPGATISGNNTTLNLNTTAGYGVEAVTNAANWAAAVTGRAKATSGGAFGVYGETDNATDNSVGVVGRANATTGKTIGVVGRTDSASDDAVGVNGQASATTGATRGVWGWTASKSDWAIGVRGSATATSGLTAGVFGETASTTTAASGVWGVANATSGVTVGVTGRTESRTNGARGVWGNATATSGQTIGVLGETNSPDSAAVQGVAYATTGTARGGDFHSVSGYGVASRSDKSIGLVAYGGTDCGAHGVYGETKANGCYASGVLGRAVADDSVGVTGIHTGARGDVGAGVSGYSVNAAGVAGSSDNGWAGWFQSGPNGNGIYAAGGTNGMAARFDGRTSTHVLEITGGSDLAEPFEIAGEVQPGTVVAIDPTRPGQLRVADKAYDRTVAGCVSGAGGIRPGLTMQQEGTAAGGTHPVALSGRVYCLADASSRAIQPGDLLTTSDTAGHVMSAVDPSRAQGAIIGKAMSSLEQGQGLVLVLVSLQ